MAGVSRGTIDRVINNRPGVSDETRQKVLRLIAETSYKPNKLGKQLAITKKNLFIGVLFHGYAEDSPYFGQVMAAMEQRLESLDEYGIKYVIGNTKMDRPQDIIAKLDEFIKMGINGLILSAINTPEIIKKIDELHSLNIPVITFSTDLPESKRLAYVGSNSYKFGAIAGNLMGLFTDGKADVGIVAGSEYSYNHQQRIAGFTDYLLSNFPKSSILTTYMNYDREKESYECVSDMLSKYKLNSIFFAAGGVRGGCQAIKDLGYAHKIKVVCFDLYQHNINMVTDKVITAAIGQQPEYQVQVAVDILVDYLGMNNAPVIQRYFSEPEIRVRANFI